MILLRDDRGSSSINITTQRDTSGNTQHTKDMPDLNFEEYPGLLIHLTTSTNSRYRPESYFELNLLALSSRTLHITSHLALSI